MVIKLFMDNKNFLRNRHIRVFMSSTFQNLQEERDYLVKKVFPILRTIAAKRNVMITEVDLRWGITEDDAKSGKVVDACFQEIDNTIPFFIGIVGNRYGWCPTEKDIDSITKERYEHIADYIKEQLSVTEMEMRYGVLDRKQKLYASFFIKSNKEIEDDVDNPIKLSNLKKKIWNADYPVSYFQTKEELGEKVKESFVGILDVVYPEENLSEKDLVQLRQNNLIIDLHNAYVSDESRYRVVDDFIHRKDFHQLFIIGDSGVGKTAFVADWIYRNQEQKKIIYYFVGSNNIERSKDELLSQLAYQLKRLLNLTGFYSLENLFEKARMKYSELVVVIDAFNQLNLKENETKMDWLPKPSTNVKYIMTTTNEAVMYLKQRESCMFYTFDVYNEKQRYTIAEKFLDIHGKQANKHVLSKIVKDEKCKNTLVLRLFLEELVTCAIHDTLNAFVKNLMEKETTEDFLQEIFKRYENDYGKMIVKKALTLLTLSFHGFSEDEIKVFINTKSSNKTLVTNLEWSQFYCAFQNHFTNNLGLLGFSHQLIKKAIEERYLSKDNNNIIREMSDLIVEKFKNIKTTRAILETVNQYLLFKRYADLHSFLSMKSNFKKLLQRSMSMLTDCWINLCVYSDVRYPLSDIVEIWSQLDDEVRQDTYNDVELMLVSIIVEEQGQWPPKQIPDCFVKMQEMCIPYARDIWSKYNYAFSVGSAYKNKRNYEKALHWLLYADHLIEDEDVINKNNHSKIIANCYNFIAELYSMQSDKNNEARHSEMLYLNKCITFCINSYGLNSLNTLRVYFRIGFIRFSNKEYAAAIDSLEKSLNIARNMSDTENAIMTLEALVQTNYAIYEGSREKNDYLKVLEYYEMLVDAYKESRNMNMYKILLQNLKHMKKTFADYNNDV